ncbi:MAG TPA: hypothetical protein VMF65_25150 [Acidimicrobiales bacterium]|nr:hypothetical protein [Acidimicrobiales bacterium]
MASTYTNPNTALMADPSSCPLDHALARGLDRKTATDKAWMLTGVELYLAAVDSCGWTAAAYAGWLAELLTSQLLP